MWYSTKSRLCDKIETARELSRFQQCRICVLRVCSVGVDVVVQVGKHVIGPPACKTLSCHCVQAVPVSV